MPNFWVDTSDLKDFDDKDLVDELERRRYKVSKSGEADEVDIEDVIWRFKAGYIKDAMIVLERLYPELYGISKLVGEK